MSGQRMSASAHVGPGASEVAKAIEQAAALIDALEYGTPQVMFDGYMLIRSILAGAVDTIDAAVLARLKMEADNDGSGGDR